MSLVQPCCRHPLSLPCCPLSARLTFSSHALCTRSSCRCKWCGHCKAIAPKWEEAATKLKAVTKDVVFANVDCTVQKKTCEEQGVPSFPMIIKFNKSNMKGEWPGAQYDQTHEVDALIKFAKEGSDVAGRDEL